jgi:hypothetical protein
VRKPGAKKKRPAKKAANKAGRKQSNAKVKSKLGRRKK